MTLTTVTAPIDRDRYGRPLVRPQGGGKPIPYTRCTTYIDCLEDKFNLQQWMQRMVALGLASRPDLLLSVSAHKDDKKALNKICEDAREAAAASAAATNGTSLHKLTEVIDRGETLPPLPPNAKASLDKYAEATAGLKATFIEQFCVQDWLKVGGTPDRIVKHGKDTLIADVKTGSIEWGVLKIAMQLAVYARSHTYDHDTGERGEHGASLERGIIIHLPAVEDPADARCDLHWVDLLAGWEAVKVARSVREKRSVKFGDLTQPFASVPLLQTVEQSIEINLEAKIRACATADAVRALWAQHAAAWTDALTAAAKQHIDSLAATAAGSGETERAQA